MSILEVHIWPAGKGFIKIKGATGHGKDIVLCQVMTEVLSRRYRVSIFRCLQEEFPKGVVLRVGMPLEFVIRNNKAGRKQAYEPSLPGGIAFRIPLPSPTTEEEPASVEAHGEATEV